MKEARTKLVSHKKMDATATASIFLCYVENFTDTIGCCHLQLDFAVRPSDAGFEANFQE